MLAAGLLPATHGALAQTTTTLLGVPVPDRVAGLPHEAPTNFETKSPGMGYGVRFSRPDWTIDVYIYDLKMKSIPDDPASAAVQEALEEAKAWLRNLPTEQVAVLTRSQPRESLKGKARATVTRFDHPYFWAAFVLSGDPD